MSFLITIVVVEFIHEVKYFLSILSKGSELRLNHDTLAYSP